MIETLGRTCCTNTITDPSACDRCVCDCHIRKCEAPPLDLPASDLLLLCRATSEYFNRASRTRKHLMKFNRVNGCSRMNGPLVCPTFSPSERTQRDSPIRTECHKLIEIESGRRSIAVLYHSLFNCSELLVPRYVAVKQQPVPASVELAVGPFTSSYFVSNGLDASFRLLNACRPVWASFSVDSIGIRYFFEPLSFFDDGCNYEIACAWGQAMSSDKASSPATSFLNDSCFTTGELPYLVDTTKNGWTAHVVRFYRACRKRITDDLFSGGQSFVIRPDGEFDFHGPVTMDASIAFRCFSWLARTLGRVVRDSDTHKYTDLDACIYATGWFLPDAKVRSFAPSRHSSKREELGFDYARAVFHGRWFAKVDYPTNNWVFIYSGPPRVAPVIDLLTCGDVEANPGPVRFVLVIMLCVYGFAFLGQTGEHNTVEETFRFFRHHTQAWLSRVFLVNPFQRFHSLVANLPSLSNHLIDTWFYAPLRNEAYRCAVQQRDNEFWAYEYDNVPYFLPIALALQRYFPTWFGDIPSRPDLDYISYRCKLAYHFVGKPVVMSLRPYVLYDYLKIVAIGFGFVFMFSSSAVCCVCFVVFVKRHRVRVINNNPPVDFSMDCAPLVELLTKHNLAKTLTMANSNQFVTDYLLSASRSCRVVSPSVPAFSTYGSSVHCCRDPTTNLIEANLAVGCNDHAYLCSQRQCIPYCYLSDVDHLFSIQELCSIVTGPTFIRTRPSALGDRFNWLPTGIVVGVDSAFEYKTVYSCDLFNLILAVPTSGIYERSSPVCMSPISVDFVPPINGYTVSQTSDHFLLKNGDDECTLLKSVINPIVTSLSPLDRDDKYHKTLTSYVSAQCKAFSTGLSHLPTVIRLCGYLADNMALTVLPRITCLSGVPADYTWYQVLKFRVSMWFINFGPMFVKRFVLYITRGEQFNKCIAWTFPTVYVPTYEIYTDINRTTRLFGRVGRFVNDRFPSSPSPADARLNNENRSCTGENTRERDHVSGNAGPQSCSQTFPPPPSPSRTQSGVSPDARPPRPSAPTWPSPADQQPSTSSGCSNAQGRKGSVGSEPSRPVRHDSPNTPIGTRNSTDSHAQPDVSPPLRPEQGERQSCPLNEHFGTSIIDFDDKDRLVCSTTYVSGKSTRLVLGEDVASALANSTRDQIDELAGWIDNIRNRASEFKPNCFGHSQIERLLRLTLASEIPSAGWVFRANGLSVFLGHAKPVDRDIFGAFELGGLVCSLSIDQAKTIERSERQGENLRVETSPPSRQKFPKNRNVRQRNRPTKHQSKV